MGFDFEKKKHKKYVVFYLKGKCLDEYATLPIIGEIESLLEENQKHFVFDMGKVELINSSGLNALIKIYTRIRNQGGEMIIIHIPDTVSTLLLITKLNTVFPVAEDLKAAEKYFNELEKNEWK